MFRWYFINDFHFSRPGASLFFQDCNINLFSAQVAGLRYIVEGGEIAVGESSTLVKGKIVRHEPVHQSSGSICCRLWLRGRKFTFWHVSLVSALSVCPGWDSALYTDYFSRNFVFSKLEVFLESHSHSLDCMEPCWPKILLFFTVYEPFWSWYSTPDPVLQPVWEQCTMLGLLWAKCRFLFWVSRNVEYSIVYSPVAGKPAHLNLMSY